MPPLFPEGLYELGAKDRQVTWLDPYIIAREATDTIGSLSVELELPDDRGLILCNAMARSQVLGAENTDLLMIQLFSSTVEITIASPAMQPGFQRQMANWSGAIFIPNAPGAGVGLTDPTRLRLRAAAFYTGVVNTKILNFSIFGMLVPMGNIQRSIG